MAIAGGVGGAKLVLGLSRLLSPDEITVVVNTGDDEEIYGLHISPDLDTIMYTLAGVYNPDTGWGLQNETFSTLEKLKMYGCETWFNLGDKDFATHILRTQMLREGVTLSQVTESLRLALGVYYPIVPITNCRLRTIVCTKEGDMRFQEYFVKYRCAPVVQAVRFELDVSATPTPEFKAAMGSARGVVICPSNPFLSVAPILEVAGVRESIESFPGLRVAVSPIVGGRALRGPAAKMLQEMGHDVSCVGVAKQYRGICDVFVIDNIDEPLARDIENLGMDVAITSTVMNTEEDKINLAKFVCGII